MLKTVYNLIFNYALFKPSAILTNFTQLQRLVIKDGIKCIVFDKDDTLVPLHSFQITRQDILLTLQKLKILKVHMIIVSNSIKSHHVIPDNVNGIPILRTKTKKPQNQEEIIRHLKSHNHNLQKQEIAVVGDRVLTDIYLGNLIGAKSYLIKPLEKTTLKKHGLGVFMMRWVQNFMIKGMENRQI